MHFEQQSPRVSALDIHEWIYETLRIPEQEVRMTQIEGAKRQVYIKMSTTEYAKEIIQTTEGNVTYKHDNGEMSIIRLELAGMETRRIRMADLPPEVPDNSISRALAQYGEVLNIQHETWSNIYRYKVPNGIRTALTSINKHVPSRTMIGGHRVTITNEGQPPTCFGCNGADHQLQQCPNRKQKISQKARTTNTWADIVQKGPPSTDKTEHPKERREERKKTTETE